MNNKLTPLHIDTNGINLLNESSIDRVKLFVKLKAWIEESLDLFKNDLLPLLHPIFLHIYIDLIHGGDVETAKAFFSRFRGDFEGVRRSNVTYEPMSAFESISNDQHVYQNPIVNGFRTHKYYLVMSKYVYNLPNKP